MTEEGKKWYDDHRDAYRFKQTYDMIYRCLDCSHFKYGETKDCVWKHTAKCTYFSDEGKSITDDGRVYLGCPSYCPLLSEDDRTVAEIRRYESYISTIEKRIEEDLKKRTIYKEKVEKLKRKLKKRGIADES